ncbi:MAG: LicD family protein [Mahellales bacterium]|jgi:lipopolysaccharide cholinephosphotransferase
MSKQLMRPDLPDEHGFLPLQNKILEIMVDVDKICRENNIDYFIMGGTALGAKRHGGFIPWDDDLDIFMTPDNYERFRETFNKFGDKEKYYLQEWGSSNGMVSIVKIRMNNTTYIEPDLKNWHMHHGIYIDIFILHTCPDNFLQQLWQCAWAKYVIMRGLCNRGYTKRKGIVGIVLKVMSLFPKRFLLNFGLKQVYRYRDKNTNLYCNFLGKAIFKKGIYKKEWFSHSKDIAFETVTLKASSNIEAFLTERFGDYMQIPSPERIKWEQHAELWDIDKGFYEYLPLVKDFDDERYLI